ncbi:helix-turn-helix domain-containing protein [Rhodopseudomonas sp. P2A-2r]|uniref:helix-turn-helix domain-containing protein n=1 Tax=Rhodopseudomonas sp. P2A-2r TaxID=2991972 RepID=UPI00223413F0|nr:helix-turn-helix domain-containing protein [Rhodopseudomonas sp. P2A-2r]UZE49814.1 helix-turn-helix domain-containing protein [Rhodopseudomonas sp. P2A-2r]
MAKPDLKLKFGMRIRGLREAQGMTQDELAEKIGRSVDTVSNIERGVYGTRIDVAGRIATILKVSVADLFSFEDDVQPFATREHRRLVQGLTAILNGLDMKSLLTIKDVIEASVKLTGRRSGRSHR